MENDTEFKEEFDKCFTSMERLINESFLKLANKPADKEIIVKLWISHISKFISYTHEAGEKNNNKDVFKAITKALVFGK